MQQPNGRWVQLFNNSNGNNEFDDASSSALLATTVLVYHLALVLALLTGNKSFIPQVERLDVS
jgi:hypothetical protein